MAGRTDLAKVALFIPTLGGGGAERVTLNLARGLAAAGVAVELVVASATGPLTEGLSDTPVVDLGTGRVITAVAPLARYLRAAKPVAIVSGMNHANIMVIWAARLARFRGRVVVVEHNDLIEGNRGGLIEGRVIPWLMKLTYPAAASVVAVSEGVKASLIERAGVSGDTVEVIYNPVLTEASRAAAAQHVDHEFFDLPDTSVIVGVGRLTAQKNFSNLLRAFAKLVEKRDARLIILGEGEERQELESLAGTLGIKRLVDFPGFVPNPHAYIRRSDLFALSSDFEGLPTVLIEALGAGARVVATDCPSGPSEILADGRYGELVPVRDPEALATAIDRSLDLAPPELGDWLEQFSLEYAASRYMETLGLEPDE